MRKFILMSNKDAMEVVRALLNAKNKMMDIEELKEYISISLLGYEIRIV